MLDALGWLSSTPEIAKALYAVAALLIVGSTAWAIVAAFRSPKKTYL
jgi:hypothetical protein